jgi:DNA-binding NarL/FixJ family response regulator
MITIVLAEDHQMVRHGLMRLLEDEDELSLVGEAGDGLHAVELVEKLKPKILLLDLMLPRLHGLEVIRRLRGQTGTKIVVVSMYADEPYVIESLKSGASGYVLKDSPPSELIEAIRTVAKGNLFISPGLRGCALSASLRTMSGGPLHDSDNLTNRERLVLQMAAEGNSSSVIARKLFLSPRTVESHRGSLMKKLGLRTQTDLVRYAIRKKIIDP